MISDALIVLRQRLRVAAPCVVAFAVAFGPALAVLIGGARIRELAFASRLGSDFDKLHERESLHSSAKVVYEHGFVAGELCPGRSPHWRTVAPLRASTTSILLR